MRKFWVSLISIVMILSVLGTLVGCNSTQRDIKARLKEFEEACHTLDLDAVLNCIDPAVTNKVKLATDVVDLLTGVNAEKRLQALARILLNEEVGGAEFFSSIKIKAEKIKVTDQTAQVSASITYHLDEEDVTRQATFSMIYENDAWYISGFTMD